jgi:hypothetical protein
MMVESPGRGDVRLGESLALPNNILAPQQGLGGFLIFR